MGSSIPIVLLPGIVEILADSELVFLAISSDKFIIFDTLTPGAGSNSFNVTTGPLLIFFIFPSTPKSKRIFSKDSSSTLFSLEILSFLDGSFKKSKEGILYFNKTLSELVNLLSNEKFSCTLVCWYISCSGKLTFCSSILIFASTLFFFWKKFKKENKYLKNSLYLKLILKRKINIIKNNNKK